MGLTVAYVAYSENLYRGCPVTDNAYLFPEEPRIIAVGVTISPDDGSIQIDARYLHWRERQFIEGTNAPAYLAEADAQAALIPLREEYDAYMTVLKFRQGECEGATRPYIALLEAQAARMTPAQRWEDTEGRVRFTFTEREKHLLSAAGIPYPYSYAVLRYPPSIESTPEFVAKWVEIIQDKVKEMTTAVDFLTRPEVTTLFPNLHE